MYKYFLLGLVFSVFIFVVACGQVQNTISEEIETEETEKGTIVFNLVRNTEGEGKDGETAEMSIMSGTYYDSRDVASVLELLEGYRVRIIGQDVNIDIITDAFFPEGEDIVQLEIILPVYNDYVVYLLALGQGGEEKNNLLGAGVASEVSIEANQLNRVDVPMETFKYYFYAPEEKLTGEQFEIMYEIRGPLLNELFNYADLYYDIGYPPETDFFIDDISDIIFTEPVIEFDSLNYTFSLSIQEQAGTLYHQAVIPANYYWEHDGIIPKLITPSVSLYETIPSMEINPSGGIELQPIWQDGIEYY